MRRWITVVLIALVAVSIGYALRQAGPRVPSPSVLVLELGGDIGESPPVEMLDRMLAPGPALPTLVLQLEKAAADDRIAAVLLHIRALDLGYARIQELRDAMGRFRQSRKPAIALLDLASLNATRELYLASSADRIYTVPGFLGPFAGIAGQFFHLGGFLERLGVEIQYERVGDYKSTPEMLAGREMSRPAREVFDRLLDGLFGQIVGSIAKGRGLEEARVRALVDQTPSTAEEYRAAGLADGTADRHQVLEQEGLGDAEELEVSDYLRVDPRDLGLRTGPAVALIFGEGMIVQSRGRAPSLQLIAADSMAESLETASRDDDIRAIVLRIDSGGGSALASDQIWRRIREARERKPVVISMGNAAASGGYYLASAADAIVAQPATLTGSIGVFLLRPALSGLYRKLGIGAEVIARGPYAAISAGDAPFTPAQRRRTRSFVHALYDGFLERVATGRGMSADAVDAVGQGRIWLGQEALGKGLVDQLGGLRAAVALAASRAGIPAGVDPRRVIFPAPRSLRAQISDLLHGRLPGQLLARLLPGSLPGALTGLAWLGRGEVVYLPWLWVEIH